MRTKHRYLQAPRVPTHQLLTYTQACQVGEARRVKSLQQHTAAAHVTVQQQLQGDWKYQYLKGAAWLGCDPNCPMSPCSANTSSASHSARHSTQHSTQCSTEGPTWYLLLSTLRVLLPRISRPPKHTATSCRGATGGGCRHTHTVAAVATAAMTAAVAATQASARPAGS